MLERFTAKIELVANIAIVVTACLLAATCYAAGYVYARHFLAGRGLQPLVLAAGQLTIGAAGQRVTGGPQLVRGLPGES